MRRGGEWGGEEKSSPWWCVPHMHTQHRPPHHHTPQSLQHTHIQPQPLHVAVLAQLMRARVRAQACTRPLNSPHALKYWSHLHTRRLRTNGGRCHFASRTSWWKADSHPQTQTRCPMYSKKKSKDRKKKTVKGKMKKKKQLFFSS